MAIGALFIGDDRIPLPGKLFMAALAVFVEGHVQLPRFTLSLRRIVTGGTLFDRLSLVPNVLAVLVFMVTLFTGFDITLGMFYMREPNRAFVIDSINFIFDEDLIGHLLRFSSF
jgi:hypothetical protein